MRKTVPDYPGRFFAVCFLARSGSARSRRVGGGAAAAGRRRRYSLAAMKFVCAERIIALYLPGVSPNVLANWRLR